MLAGGLDFAEPQWIVYFRRHPQSVQQHRKLSSYGHDGAFLVVLTATAG